MSAMMGLGVATYLSMYPALLVGPMVLLGYDRQEEEKARIGISGKGGKKAEAAKGDEEASSSSSIWFFAAKHTAMFLAGLAWLLYISYILTGGSCEFITSTYGVQLLVPDLTPNVGLWWYFFIEMFDSFREFFLGVFWLHLGGYVGGLCIRLRKQPLFVVVTMMGIFAIFKPYPTIGDTGLWLSMLPLYRHVFGCEFCLLGLKDMMLTWGRSDEVYFLRRLCPSLCLSSRAGVLPLVGICRFWKCQLLLCHHACLEPGAGPHPCRFAVRGAER